MTWKYQILGEHVHVTVFMNGANCGNLTFRLYEFIQLEKELTQIDFVELIQTNQPDPFGTRNWHESKNN